MTAHCTIEQLNHQNTIQSLKVRIEGFQMKYFSRRIAALVLSALVAITSAAPAFADSASSKAAAKLAELEQHKTTLVGIRAEIATFNIKSSYCDYFHKDDKRADEAALKALSDRLAGEQRAVSLIRRILTATVTRNQAARTALDQELAGGSGSIVDGSLFRPFNRILAESRRLLTSKKAELKAAPTRPCGSAAGNGSAVSTPTFTVVNPLLDVSTTAEYEDIGQTGIPNRFCHEDEKREVLDRISSMRGKAQSNELLAANLRDKLRQLQSQIKAKRQAAWNAADAAAKAGQTTTQNNQVRQLRAYDAALKKIAAGIRQAVAAQRKWRNRDLQLAKDWKTVQAMPISDCTDPNLTPGGTLGGSQFQEIGGLAAPNLKPVDIPSIPAKVCIEAVKREIETKAFTALRNSWHNRDQWNARIDATNTALKTATGNARQPLINARAEARQESAKWIKLVKTASDANDRAQAIVVEDCSNSGGLLEIGKMSSSMPGVHAGVPEAVTTPYDLPEVPEYVCTWEEKQALIARAAKAREAASANHRQWGPRASAFGDLLYGEDAVGGDRTDLLNAHAEARAQTDYWAEQMLDVAHRVYWQLRGLEVRDCEQPDNKTSLNSLSGTGNAVGGQNANSNGGSRIGVLQDAINSRPVYNGGNGAGGAPSGRDCIIQQGGCFYPDPRNDWMYQPTYGENGFDGSEAENVLHHTLGNVEPAHVHTADCDHGKAQSRNNYGGAQNSTGNAKVEPKTEGSTLTRSGTFSSGADLEVETAPIEYRNGSNPVTVTKQPGITKYNTPSGSGPSTSKVEIESLPAQNVPKVETGSISIPKVSGNMVQVAPPQLVITVGVAGGSTSSTTAQTAAEIEAAGGQ